MGKAIENLIRALGLPPKPPRWLVLGAIFLVVLSWLPLVLAMRARATDSVKPRVHFFQDMDAQPRFGPQATNARMPMGRSMLAPVQGTVARGQLREDDHYYRGYRVVVGEDGKETRAFFEGLPPELKVDDRLLQRGRKMFDIHCSSCHGYDGGGQGPVAVWYNNNSGLPGSKWIPMPSLHQEIYYGRADGHVFNTITHGINNNMPPYGGQIDVADRWAIVAYLRALQLSQNLDVNRWPQVRQQLR